MVKTATLSLALSVLGASSAQAYYSVIDTGEVITPHTYQVSLEPQLITNRYDGAELVGRFDAGLDEASSVRGTLGVGSVHFEIGGFYKYVPFPDVGNQPAVGGEAGVIIATVPAGTEISFRFHPLVSKRLETEIGDFIPYASLPLGLTFRPDRTVIPIQVALGTEFRPLNYQNLSGFFEIGVDMLDAFGYVSIAAAYRFDDATIRGRRRKSTASLSPLEMHK
jgi:hypothetical protein